MSDARVSFESPPPSKTGQASSISPSLNVKYDNWVQKMRNWTSGIATPDSKADISLAQRTKGSGLGALSRFQKKSRTNAYQGQSKKVKRPSMNAISERNQMTLNSSTSKGKFLSKVKMAATHVRSSEQILRKSDAPLTINDWSQDVDGILFFNNDVQEIYGSDCDLL
jgi:hypothetical protein